MRIFVLTATYELRVSRKSHLRDHPTYAPRVMTKKKKHLIALDPLFSVTSWYSLKNIFFFAKINAKFQQKNVNVDSLKRIASGSEMKLKKFVFYFSIYERDRSGGFSLKCRNVLRAAPSNLKIFIFPIFMRKFSKASKWSCFQVGF